MINQRCSKQDFAIFYVHYYFVSITVHSYHVNLFQILTNMLIFFFLTSTFFYGSHLILLIALLFARIYFIFDETLYKLSETTIHIFIALFIFEICDVAIYILLVTCTIPLKPYQSDQLLFITYLIGVANMFVIVLWISILYVYKLFTILSNTSDNSNPITEKLFTSVTKHTLLALIWISTLISFWCIPISFRQYLNYDAYLLLHHGFMLLDVNTNAFTFVLGFQFAHKTYMRCCSCTHNKFKKLIKNLVQSEPEIPVKKKVQILQITMPPKAKLVVPELKVWSTSTAGNSSVSSIVSSGNISLPSTTLSPHQQTMSSHTISSIPTTSIQSNESISSAVPYSISVSVAVNNGVKKDQDSPLPKKTAKSSMDVEPYDIDIPQLPVIQSNKEMIYQTKYVETPQTPLINIQINVDHAYKQTVAGNKNQSET
eukprot:452944_1